MNGNERVWVDGKRLEGVNLPISPFSETLLYGRGLFETMAFHDGVLQFWEFHLDRLYAGGEDLGFDMPPRGELTSHVREVIRSAGLADVRIRLLLFHDGISQSPGVLLYLSELPETPDSPVRLILSDVVRSVPSTPIRRKTTSYLDELIVQRRATAAGAFDGVMLATDGTVAEGSRSNIFINLDGIVRTPPVATGLLPGVGRRGVLSGAGELGIVIEESEFRVEELRRAEGIVVVNALRGVRPVSQIDFREEEGVFDCGSDSRPLADLLRSAFDRGCETSSLHIER